MIKTFNKKKYIKMMIANTNINTNIRRTGAAKKCY